MIDEQLGAYSNTGTRDKQRVLSSSYSSSSTGCTYSGEGRLVVDGGPS